MSDCSSVQSIADRQEPGDKPELGTLPAGAFQSQHESASVAYHRLQARGRPEGEEQNRVPLPPFLPFFLPLFPFFFFLRVSLCFLGWPQLTQTGLKLVVVLGIKPRFHIS